MISFGGHRGNCGQTTWLQGHSEGESAGGVCAPSRVKRGIKHKIICSKHSVKVYRRWMTGSVCKINAKVKIREGLGCSYCNTEIQHIATIKFKLCKFELDINKIKVEGTPKLITKTLTKSMASINHSSY